VLNTLDGEIVTTADGASVRTPVALFPLADTGAASRPIRIGIRPEWLRLSTHPLPEAKALEVTLIEPLGAEILVHARWSSGELFARAPALQCGAQPWRTQTIRIASDFPLLFLSPKPGEARKPFDRLADMGGVIR
jgi:ABC-type sugar transport system ATPase subunit